MISEVFIKWQKDIDNAILGEIKEKAIEHGIKTEYILNEKAIISALKKQIPQLVELTDDCCICPNCRFDMMGVYDFTSDDTKDPSYCPECGQALDWSDTE